MMANLIENGVRHNVRGGFLEVTTTTRDGRVQLEVVNGGPPIDPADARTLAEPFRRLGRGYDGFGLGLSIVRSVAEVHGGTLELTARESGGLAVRVSLPAAPLTARAVPRDPAFTES
jgi:signal transduction histidine kinase